MRHSGKLAALALFSLLGAGCHKKTLAAPPPVPAPPDATPSHPRAATSAASPTTPNPATPSPPTPTPVTPSPTTPAPAPPPRQPAQPEFRLGQALTPEELRTNNVLIDRHLQEATQALASIGNRRLTNEQKSSVAQIRGFIDQARQMRGTDVLRARSLAERADVLAQDLLAGLK